MARSPTRPPPLPAPARDAGSAPSTASAHWTAEIARGDRDAVAAFYDLWFDRALALARRTLRGDTDGALDVVQDVMLRVARSMPALDDERAVAAWMARAVFRAAIDRLRADARRAHHEDHAAAERAADRSVLDPHAAIELTERARWLRARIDELPRVDRDAVLLRYAGDATLDAVGAELGITGHAAHGRIRRAVRRLQEMAKEVFGDGCP